MKAHCWLPALAFVAAAFSVFAPTNTARAHGSVTPEEDLCVIRIGYYSAHFKIYQPRTRRHVQFCEDLPATGESVFVMEYEHSGLGEVPVDFRIIRNVTGQGQFTRLKHVRAIPDLDAHTVYHLPAELQPDVFTAMYEFTDRGDFVGIVSVTEPVTREVYTAVFPFRVGFAGFGFWPLFAVAMVLLQLNYLWMSGWFSARSWRGLLPKRLFPALAIVCMALCVSVPAGSVANASESDLTEPVTGKWWQSEAGHYSVQAHPQISPLGINRMHSWIIELRTTDGDAVATASISVTGGMPAHDHGLATRPRVTRHLGGGRYLLEGVRFHMHGTWQLRFKIEEGDNRDEVVISFEL